ncbi:MAG TPA: NADH-ubiquinone oxidoreductase-F iron-sulfur binding region domain-containing protein [Bacteroidia bacterium]|nr:NADH-ubiquinone oxidoreductase-F iron-sulfur binding region domain-containing protein [Bacteroidia bacterium]HRS58892.1 NADH-ubiquinone oxidoreductase-F iron-sulfur binding region domain-containing protein [Bacteroidia bacterium]HRU67389.1 NADH-ubiquinone oxidoreductase-F iron-sulfur binding region domain-containing protein [Bacteroidia bacterium]
MEILKEKVLAKNKYKEPDSSPDKICAYLRKELVDRPVIFVGAGTCGLGAGAGKTMEAIENYLKSNEIKADVVRVGCIGLCSSEPIVDVKLPGKKRISFEQVTQDKVTELLQSVMNGRLPVLKIIGQFDDEGEAWENVPFISEHPFFRLQKRLVLENCGISDPVSIEEYIARGGYQAYLQVIKGKSREDVCDEVLKSGLRGRGGGGFSTGTKWKLGLASPADQKYLICNADEGDPGAFMDRAVIEGDPHKLLEGMCIAAYAIGATKAYVYIRAEYPLAIERLIKAIADAKEYGLIGKNIFGTGQDLEIIIKKGAGAFVCGEETALIHSIEGKRGMPRPRPPYPTTQGLFGKPTVINNVETLANVPSIFNKGADYFASMGTKTSKGTKVFALSGKIKRTGLVEIPMGTTIREIIFNIGGGIKNERKFKAVQMGGPSGGCVTEVNLDIPIDYESLLSVGAMMGSGGMVVMDEDTCMVDVAKFFMDFIQRESCGKCIPCREGTKVMLETLEEITKKPFDGNALSRFKKIVQLENLAMVIKDTSLCGLGQSAPNPVLSTLRWFRDEYEEHIYERHCRAGVCQGLRTYVIDDALCTGCTACTKKCPVNAIVGSRKNPHYIIAEKCTGCGSCQAACNFGAIYIEGEKKQVQVELSLNE